MTLTLLLDLDDTLLSTNIEVFIPAYFKKLTEYMSKIVPPEVFVKTLMRSTQIMYGNKRTDLTLEQVFDINFYPALGFRKADLASELEKFYDDVFPTLSSLTSPRQEAIDLVEWSFSKGWKIAIATDPLFPRKAILHRLRWAGLDPEKHPFTLISDFHNFHFAKSSVAFYPEFLAHMNWLVEPVLMVGDSLERDILPSIEAGLPVFWLKNSEPDVSVQSPQGWYAQLRNYLETADLSSLKVNYRSPMALIAFLRSTPAVFHSLLLLLSREQAAERPDVNEWSFLEILCHLRDVDSDVNLLRVAAILREENTFVAGQSTDQWANERNYSSQDLMKSFSDFVSVREKLVSLLENLESGNWDRSARHTFLGPTSLRELVEIMVDHDRLHIRQAMDAIKPIGNQSWEFPL